MLPQGQPEPDEVDEGQENSEEDEPDGFEVDLVEVEEGAPQAQVGGHHGQRRQEEEADHVADEVPLVVRKRRSAQEL